MYNFSDIIAKQFWELEESRREMLNRAVSSMTQHLTSQSIQLREVAQTLLSAQRISEQIPKIDFSSLAASIPGITTHQPLSSLVRQLDAIQHIFPSQVDRQQLMAVSSTLSSGVNQQLLESLRQNISKPFSFAQLNAVKESLYSASRFIDQQQLSLLSKTLLNATNIDLQKLGALAGSQVFAALKYTIPEISSDQIAMLGSSFSGRLAASIAKALELLAEDPNAFVTVKEMIRAKVESLPSSRISAEGLWQIFIQILMVLIGLTQPGLILYQIREANASSKKEREYFKQLIETTREVAANTERLVPKQDRNVYYIVERTVSLQLKPTTNSNVLARLFPNQKVCLVKRKHKWIYIEFFDYLEGIPKYGWALKKYLIKIEPATQSKSTIPDSMLLRPMGLCKGEFIVPENFDESLPEEIIHEFEGR